MATGRTKPSDIKVLDNYNREKSWEDVFNKRNIRISWKGLKQKTYIKRYVGILNWYIWYLELSQ